jgi:hypothetical protein
MLLKPWELHLTIKQLMSLHKVKKRPIPSKMVRSFLAKLAKGSLYFSLIIIIIGIAAATRIGGLILVIYLLVRLFSPKKQK